MKKDEIMASRMTTSAGMSIPLQSERTVLTALAKQFNDVGAGIHGRVEH